MLNLHNRAYSWKMKRPPAGGRVKHMCVWVECSQSTRRKSMREEYNDSDRNPTLCTTWGHLLWFNTQSLHMGSVNGRRFREKHPAAVDKKLSKTWKLTFLQEITEIHKTWFLHKKILNKNKSQITLEYIRTPRRFRQLLNSDILKTLWNKNVVHVS